MLTYSNYAASIVNRYICVKTIPKSVKALYTTFQIFYIILQNAIDIEKQRNNKGDKNFRSYIKTCVYNK